MIPAAILALAQLAPAILPFLTKNETAAKAAQAVSTVARVVTGASSDEAALNLMGGDPKLLMEYQQAMSAQAVALYQEETKRLEAVNETMRAEYTSGDPYVRRARPTFMYSMAASWTVQMMSISILIVWKPEHAATVIAAVVGLGTMWAVALAMVGVAVHKRSEDKQVAAGMQPAGILGGIKGLLGR